MKCNFQRHSHVTPRFGSAETSFSEKAFRTSKNEPKYLHQPSRDSYVSVIPITQSERGYLSLRFLFRSIMLTLNRPGFSESGTAGGGGGRNAPPPRVTSLFEDHDHEIWCCHTKSKALPGNNKTFDDIITMTF